MIYSLTFTVSSLFTTLFKGFSHLPVGEPGHDRDLLRGFKFGFCANDDFKMYLLVRFFNSTSPLKQNTNHGSFFFYHTELLLKKSIGMKIEHSMSIILFFIVFNYKFLVG